jgi:hypothetical protein
MNETPFGPYCSLEGLAEPDVLQRNRVMRETEFPAPFSGFIQSRPVVGAQIEESDRESA